MNISLVAMLFDPILITALLLFFVKIIRNNFLIVFIVVAILHIFALSYNPIRDDYYWNFLFSRVWVDGILIIGLGYGLKYFANRKPSNDNEKFSLETELKKLKIIGSGNGLEKNIFWIAPIVVMAIGIAPMPIGYYTLLRLVVCGCSIYYAYHLYEKEDKTFVWVFGFFVVLYNPIIPIYLYDKQIWIVVNIITGLVFFWKRNSIEQK